MRCERASDRGARKAHGVSDGADRSPRGVHRKNAMDVSAHEAARPPDRLAALRPVLARPFDACPVFIDATALAQERGAATLVARRGAAALLLLSKEGDDLFSIVA